MRYDRNYQEVSSERSSLNWSCVLLRSIQVSWVTGEVRLKRSHWQQSWRLSLQLRAGVGLSRSEVQTAGPPLRPPSAENRLPLDWTAAVWRTFHWAQCSTDQGSGCGKLTAPLTEFTGGHDSLPRGDESVMWLWAQRFCLLKSSSSSHSVLLLFSQHLLQEEGVPSPHLYEQHFVCLSENITSNTAFSRALKHLTLRLSYFKDFYLVFCSDK